MNGALSAAAWLALFAVYLGSVPGTFYFEDSPELMTVAMTLGNSHPPGYALMSLLGKLASLLPAGSVPFRLNLMSAGAAAGAAVLLADLVAGLGRRFLPRGAAVAAGLLAAGAWGWSDSFWWQACIGDKYPVYYLLFVLILRASLAAWDAPPSLLGRRMLVLLFLTALGFTQHLYTLFSLPAVALPAARFMLAGSGRRRTAALAALFALVPLSLKAVYPPVRSAGGAEMDWGIPHNAPRLARYLQARLYHHAFSSISVRGEPGAWPMRLRLFGRLLVEEMPPALLVAVPVGAVALARVAPWPAAVLAACAVADGAYAMNFFGEVVRWYEPMYALAAAAAALGWAWVAARLVAGAAGVTGGAAALVAFLALAASGWQFARGRERNDLARFYLAHDFARNILRSVPPSSIYLGAGDFDLFPLWAARHLFGERPDVEAVGLGSFADTNLAGMGGQLGLLGRAGIRGTGGEALAVLIRSGKRPIMIPPSSFQRELWAALPFLKVSRFHGIAARLLSNWDPYGSYTATRRTLRTYSLRGLMYGRPSALFDLDRVRDEVARGALMHYPACMSGLGQQLSNWRFPGEAAWALRQGVKFMEPMIGPIELPSMPRWMPDEVSGMQAAKAALSRSYLRLAEIFEARGVLSQVDVLRYNASVLSQ